jgi:hypothetical protein
MEQSGLTLDVRIAVVDVELPILTPASRCVERLAALVVPSDDQCDSNRSEGPREAFDGGEEL